jgi:hypothetical protein
MSFLWHFYWPATAVALVIGIIAGRYAFYRAEDSDEPVDPRPASMHRRKRGLGIGFAASLAAALLWHGPLGAAGRLADAIQASVTAELAHQEMTSVQGRIERGPLRRSIVLTGPADAFQRAELVRIMRRLPGVNNARWIRPPLGGSASLPLIVEAALLALLGFLPGLLLSYLLELRRRSNAQWSW